MLIESLRYFLAFRHHFHVTPALSNRIFIRWEPALWTMTIESNVCISVSMQTKNQCKQEVRQILSLQLNSYLDILKTIALS